MGMVSEFKEFAVKGNVIDLAVGVIIGGAFGKIVDSIVTDLIMPIVSMVFGRLDFSNWFLPLAKIPPGTTETLVELRKAGVETTADRDIIALIAYLQRIGTDIKSEASAEVKK